MEEYDFYVVGIDENHNDIFLFDISIKIEIKEKNVKLQMLEMSVFVALFL